MEILLVLLALAILFGPLIGVIVLAVREGDLRRRIESLETAGREQADRLEALRRALRVGDAEPPPAPDAGRWTSPEPAPPLERIAETPPEPAQPPAPEPEPAAAGAEPPPPEAPPGRARPPAVARPERPAASPRPDMEEALASRWMVWLGAVAVALAAVFLFRYAVEQGWLGPALRVGLGLALGVALVAGGEAAHRRSVRAVARVMSPDHVPPALTAAGVFALYASAFAAHGLYGLIGPAVAFAALAAISLAALALALRLGLLVAVLGLAGGYLVPLLVSSDTPAALPVFLFLFVLSAACLALMRWRRWRVLALAVTAGAFAWPVLWLADPRTIADQPVLGAYAVAMAAAFAALSVGWPVKRPERPALAWLAGTVSDTSGLGFALAGALAVLLALVSDYDEGAFLILGGYAVVGPLFGLRRAAYESLAVVGALVVAVAVLLWPQPATLSPPEALREPGVESYATGFGPALMPPEFLVFARALAGLGLLFGLGGVLAQRRAATPGVWAALAAAMPLYLLASAYWRIGDFGIDPGWAAIAAGLALANLGAATLATRAQPPARHAAALAFHAAGATGALALAFACLLREAWLTAALSAEVLALAWIWSRLKVDELRAVIWLVAVGVIVRLVLNPYVAVYEGGFGALVGWVAYGYGLPAVAFVLAGRLLRREGPDPLSVLCETAAVAFAVIGVALQIRLWTSGALDAPGDGLFEQAMQTAWWLIAAAILLRREAVARLATARGGGAALLALAGLQIALGHLLAQNPLHVAAQVGSLPVLNLLGLAYLLPALMLAGLASCRGVALPDRLRPALGAAAGVLGFVWLSLEVRRAFNGTKIFLEGRPPSDAEIYAYSAAWLAASLVLLGIGILRRARTWRLASLALLMATALKVFLYDMSDLTGLLRVASFLGLGLALIGIGWLHRRFVQGDGGGRRAAP